MLVLIFAGCGNKTSILHTIDDLNGRHIAILNHAVSDKEFKEQFPESDLSHFKSSSEFLLAIAIGKCNAGIVITKTDKGVEIEATLAKRETPYLSQQDMEDDLGYTILSGLCEKIEEETNEFNQSIIRLSIKQNSL